MAAIGRSDGTRASVLHELRASEVNDGIIGSFRFDANGDMTTASIPILRITGATPPGAGLRPNSRERRSIASCRCRQSSSSEDRQECLGFGPVDSAVRG